MKTFSLENKRALITGSTQGIGRSIAVAFAQAGAKVVLHSAQRDAAMQEALIAVDDVGQGQGIEWIGSDFAEEGGRILGEKVQEDGAVVDILVLCASIQSRKPWNEMETKEAEQQFRVNFQASWELCQAVVPGMRQKGWGRILTIGSVQQMRPHPEMMIYAATKAAQMNMVLNLAKQLAPNGITVNNLAPGVILTERNTDALAHAAYADRVRATIPAGFFGEPADCAGAALLLCSEAGRYITGQNLFVDGGMSLS